MATILMPGSEARFVSGVTIFTATFALETLFSVASVATLVVLVVLVALVEEQPHPDAPSTFATSSVTQHAIAGSFAGPPQQSTMRPTSST